MATFTLSDFASEVLSKAGLARTNRFDVEILRPRGLSDPGNIARLASLYVEQSSLPPINLAVKPYKIFGPAYQRPITSEYGGDGITMTFHVDRDMRIKRFFEDWLHLIVDPVTFTVGFQDNYSTTISIKQLDEQENITHHVELLEAFPRSINLMELNNSSTNQTHRLNVVFAYHYWKMYTPSTPVDIPQPVINPQIPSIDTRLPLPQTRRQWNWQTGTLEESPGSDLPPAA